MQNLLAFHFHIFFQFLVESFYITRFRVADPADQILAQANQFGYYFIDSFTFIF